MQKLALVIALTVCATSAQAEEVWVQVKESKLRAQPSFFATSVGDLKYGDRLDMVSGSKGWAQVQTARKKAGYIPVSAVTPQQIVFNLKSVPKLEADPADVVLAGRGFSKEVESEYKQRDAAARFDLVDLVERGGKVSSAEMVQFVKAGGLQ